MELMRSLPRISLSLLLAMSCRAISTFAVALFAFARLTQAQLQSAQNDAIKVTVSQNDDGSRTAYEHDPADHRATATTTAMNGKLLGKVRYKLDDAGRYLSGEVIGPDDKLRYKTAYKYEPGTGRLAEETQLTTDGAVKLRLVFSYDSGGKQAGYSVFDANGKLLGQTSKRP